MARQRNGEVRQCLRCGKDMYLARSELQRRKYCSIECNYAAIDERRAGTCAECGLPFAQSPSRLGKYCGWKCYLASRRGRLPRQHAEERLCEGCSKPMMVQPHLFESIRFCGKACHDESKRLKGPGAKYKRKDGYIFVYYPTHPDSDSDGRIMEHRLVMEQKLGRRLVPTEHVNHINHIRDDNRPENLELMTPGDHARESNAFGKAHRKSIRDRLAAYEARFGPLD
jgi:hypothetical protein